MKPGKPWTAREVRVLYWACAMLANRPRAHVLRWACRRLRRSRASVEAAMLYRKLLWR